MAARVESVVFEAAKTQPEWAQSCIWDILQIPTTVCHCSRSRTGIPRFNRRMQGFCRVGSQVRMD